MLYIQEKAWKLHNYLNKLLNIQQIDLKLRQKYQIVKTK